MDSDTMSTPTPANCCMGDPENRIGSSENNNVMLVSDPLTAPVKNKVKSWDSSTGNEMYAKDLIRIVSTGFMVGSEYLPVAI
ncbi:hypothetical protein D3C73_1588110 [compost metagenome]